MFDAEDFVQTHPLLLKVASTFDNTVDPRNWKLTIFLGTFDMATTLASAYYAYGDWPPFVIMIIALVLMIAKIPFVAFYMGHAEQVRDKFATAIAAKDSDKDGLLTREEAADLDFPPNTFAQEFSLKVDRYSVDHLMWYAHRPRVLCFRVFEFVSAYLVFFASLMLFAPGDSFSSVIFVQGVVSVVSLTIVLNDLLSEHGKKYHAKSAILRRLCNCVFVIMLLGTMLILFSGYAFTAELYALRVNLTLIATNDTNLAQDQIGAAAGGIVTLIELILLALYLMGFKLLVCGKCIDARVLHVGDDDPIKMFRRNLTSVRQELRENKKFKSDLDRELRSGAISKEEYTERLRRGPNGGANDDDGVPAYPQAEAYVGEEDVPPLAKSISVV